MSNHLPGPWMADTLVDGPETWVVSQVTPYARNYVEGICTLDPQGNHTEANARLIAAAPELLDSLTALVGLARRRGRIDEYKAAVDMAQTAIDKATEGGA